MIKRYEIIKLSEHEYMFDTHLGLSYSIELKKSNIYYQTNSENIKFIYMFRFSIYDRDYPIDSDYRVRYTILHFILNYFQNDRNDAILFFINNEFESNTLSHRAKSRIKLFRRLFRIAKKHDKDKFIFLTNEHFVINHREYKIDYIGIIIRTTSTDYYNIVRAFNHFCYKKSYYTYDSPPLT